MKILSFSAILLASVSFAFAAVATPYTKAMCMSLGEVGLINLDSLGCSDHIVQAPNRIADKVEVCSALHRGGLVNLEHVGCPPAVLMSRDRDDRNVGRTKAPWKNGPGKRHGNATSKAHHKCHHHRKPHKEDHHPGHPEKEDQPKKEGPTKGPEEEVPSEDPKEEDPAEDPKKEHDTPEKCGSQDICKIFQNGLVNINILNCNNRSGKREDTDIGHDDPECRKKTCEIMQQGLANLAGFGCS
ncbi:hypothetical protein CF319_g6576 [Tilletia indica]|nr:hypothetical protein CF319_g6576 [Tilletia indica]